MPHDSTTMPWMEMLAAGTIALVIGVFVAHHASQSWLGLGILLAFTSFPEVIPLKIGIGNSSYGLYLHELPLLLGALYLLVARPANRSTDWCAGGIGAIA